MKPAVVEPLRLLAEADAVLLTARLLDRPRRAKDGLEQVAAADLQRLAAAAGRDRQYARLLIDAVRGARAIDPGAWAEEHARLFEGAVVCPINETAYVRRDKGAILADLCGFYRAFGFEPAAGTGEKADHLVTELEFLGLLLVMLARARAAGNAEHEQIAASALDGFVRDHVAEWTAAFCERLEQTTSTPHYRQLAAALRAITGAIYADRGLAPSEAFAAPPDAGSPYECGMADCAAETPLLEIGDP